MLVELRSGPTIHCPNVKCARVPIYEIFAEDAYDLDGLVRDLPEGFTAVDIGGQIGCFTVALASHRPDAQIHTYEASPVTAGWLRRNVVTNDLDAQVEVNATAVSDHTGTLQFRDNGAGSGLNGITASADSGTVVDVPCVTFDEAVERAGGEVSLVKMDTEGAEYDIVLASAQESWAGVQRMVIEYHPVPGHSWDELQTFLHAVGLKTDRVDPVEPGLGTAWLSRPRP